MKNNINLIFIKNLKYLNKIIIKFFINYCKSNYHSYIVLINIILVIDKHKIFCLNNKNNYKLKISNKVFYIDDLLIIKNTFLYDIGFYLNILLKLNSKKKIYIISFRKIFWKLRFIYKRNNELLKLNNDNINDVKNRVYIIKTIQEIILLLLELNIYNKRKMINSNYDINEFKKNYKNAIKYFNNSTKINNEIRNILFHVSANFLSQYYYNETIYKEINYDVNKISHNKIIILNKFYSENIMNFFKFKVFNSYMYF